ncbi:MAG TPA: BlaI/MecI/CopY family transcriptional regulator [Pirellulales bacterium]|jgi:predicted transcriptional regulator|nr:BlaI/MecI/CopY family transcriptional regulator [Pirellulales bacterium]
MKKRPAKFRVAAGELELLEVLWAKGAATLSEVHKALDRQIGYTTVQVRLQRMVDKGLCQRRGERPAKYRPLAAPEEVSASHLGLLLQRISGGRIAPLVAQLIRQRRLEPDEIAELKQLIAEAEARALVAHSRKEPL